MKKARIEIRSVSIYCPHCCTLQRSATGLPILTKSTFQNLDAELTCELCDRTFERPTAPSGWKHGYA